MSADKLPVFSVKSFQNREAPEPGFYIRTFPEHRKEHPFIMKPHRHDFYLLMLFTKGSGSHTIDLNTYEVRPGSVFIMSPGEMHSWSLSDDTDGYVLMFNTSFYIMNVQNRNISEFSFFSPENKVNHGQLRASQLKDISSLLKEIYRESLVGSREQTRILRSYLDILLLKFAGMFGKENAAWSDPAAELISKLERLISLHYKSHQPASFYAAQLAISTVQLNSISRNYLDKSVSGLVQERLLLEAKRLLIYTRLSISEISHELNFNDNSYFTKFFKKSVGQTPDQFRKGLLVP